MTNIHIPNSYLTSKHDFVPYLDTLRSQCPDNEVLTHRSNTSLCLEWASHNFLYDLHIARERAKDCDLNYPQKLWEKIAYPIVGSIGWIFIK